jgi:1-acyl-sn-glycerol-3-phosphate acyltransferase
MNAELTVQEYVAMQPKLAWRRRLMRKWLIRGLGFHILWKVDVTGLENIPDSGPAIIMMNHVSLLDPGLCMGAVQNRFVIAMTKVENLKNPITAAIIKWWGAFRVNPDRAGRYATP